MSTPVSAAVLRTHIQNRFVKMTTRLRLLDLAGRCALVTGASNGIGRAVALALARQGCAVSALDLAPPAAAADDTDAAVGAGGSITFVRCDVSQSEAVDAAVAQVRDSCHGALDYLVNVAGIDPKVSLEDGDAAAWDRVLDTNLRSQYLLIRRAAPLLERGRGKAIVNVSSLSAYLGVRRRAIYSASKAGVFGLTTGLARELGDRGIRINSVAPGWVFTPRQVSEYFAGAEREGNEAYLDSVQSLRGKRIAPDEIAAPILFLLSEASGAITGSNIMADGGWRLQ